MAIPHITAYRGKFCDKIFPDPHARMWNSDESVHQQLRLICCDCGLSHDIEFQVVQLVKNKGIFRPAALASKFYAVQLRLRRNDRSTAQVRRKRQKRT